MYVDEPVFSCPYSNFVVPTPNTDGEYVYNLTDLAPDLLGFECITSTSTSRFVIATLDAPPSDVATQLATLLQALPGMNTPNMVVTASSSAAATGRR